MSNSSKHDTQELCRKVRTEMARHSVNCAEVQISAHHGMVILYGRVRPLRGHESNFESELNNLLQALRHRPGIRDVVAEWTRAV